MTRSTRSHGFTLIELMVVVAIVGLLASVLFPVLFQAREAAKKATCISNLRNMALGTIMYADDHDGGSYTTQMIYEGIGPDGKTVARGTYVYWYGLVWRGEIYPSYSPVWPYLHSRDIQQCASAKGYYRHSSNVTTVGFAPNVGTFGNMVAPKNIANMVLPAETIMYGDSAYWLPDVGLVYARSGTMSCTNSSLHARHTGALSTVAWWDGHAKSHSLWLSQGTGIYERAFARYRLGALLKFSKDPRNLARPVGADDASNSGPSGYDCYYYQSSEKIQP